MFIVKNLKNMHHFHAGIIGENQFSINQLDEQEKDEELQEETYSSTDVQTESDINIAPKGKKEKFAMEVFETSPYLVFIMMISYICVLIIGEQLTSLLLKEYLKMNENSPVDLTKIIQGIFIILGCSFPLQYIKHTVILSNTYVNLIIIAYMFFFKLLSKINIKKDQDPKIKPIESKEEMYLFQVILDVLLLFSSLVLGSEKSVLLSLLL